MTRTPSFSKSRASFSKRGAQHILGDMTVPIAQVQDMCRFPAEQSLCACTARGTLPQEHRTRSTCVAALPPAFCLAGRRARQKNGSWYRMSG